MLREACACYGTKAVAKKLSVRLSSMESLLNGEKTLTKNHRIRTQKMLNLYPVIRNNSKGMKILSFFSGAGGLDLGFQKAGFDVIWANEYDREIWETYERNHQDTILDRRSITEIDASDLPDCDGIIGGPPCQSWSEAGSQRGINDHRGQLFHDFIRILREKKPKFFLAENVSGMLASRHAEALSGIKKMFTESGYTLHFKLLNASDYSIPQDRKRVFFIGIRNDLNINYIFPEKDNKIITLRDSIGDLASTAIPAKEKNYSNKEYCVIPNNEFMIGGFSSMFLSRNRVRPWNEVSFTIQAGGRHAPLHPQAPKMVKLSADEWIFKQDKELLYRRLSVRESARIQTFPDDFIFFYDKLSAGYKMVGNAVPVELAYRVACSIKKALNKR